MSVVVPAAVTAVTFVALFAGHQVGDHVVQTAGQATAKAAPSADRLAAGAHPWTGWWACARHVVTYSATQAAALLLAWPVAQFRVYGLVAALAVSAGTHAVIDRRWIVRWLIEVKRCHAWREAPYVIDQSVHIAALFIAAVLAAVVDRPGTLAITVLAAAAVVGTGLGAERRRTGIPQGGRVR